VEEGSEGPDENKREILEAHQDGLVRALGVVSLLWLQGRNGEKGSLIARASGAGVKRDGARRGKSTS